MNLFKTLGIRSKLMISFSASMIFTVIICAITMLVMGNIRTTVDYTHTYITDKYVPTAQLSRNLTYISSLAFSFVNNKTSFTISNQNEVAKKIEEIQAEATKVLVEQDEETQQLLKAINEMIKAYQGPVLGSLLKNQQQIARASYVMELQPNLDAAQGLLTKRLFNLLNNIVERVDGLNSPTPVYVVILSTICALILSVIIALMFSASMKRVLSHAVDVAERIASGDLTGKVVTNRKDEFGQLMQALEDMRADWHDLAKMIKTTTLAVEENFSNIDTLTSEIDDSARETENRSITVAAASDEMVSTTSDIAKNAQVASQSAEDSSATTSEGVKKVQETIALIRAQAEKTRGNAERVGALVEQSEKIGTIVQTIEDIANQTNLLALNAAIEAARAGEAGKGFAVVADEVRSLASRTSASTSDIINMVTAVQQDAGSANDSISASVTEMDQLATASVAVENLLHDIINKVTNVDGQINQISTAVVQQNTATSEISSNMQNITSSAKDLASKVSECKQHVGTAEEVMQRLVEQVDKIRVE